MVLLFEFLFELLICFAESSNKRMQNLQLEPKKFFASVNAQEEKPFDFLRLLFGMVEI